MLTSLILTIHATEKIARVASIAAIEPRIDSLPMIANIPKVEWSETACVVAEDLQLLIEHHNASKDSSSEVAANMQQADIKRSLEQIKLDLRTKNSHCFI